MTSFPAKCCRLRLQKRHLTPEPSAIWTSRNIERPLAPPWRVVSSYAPDPAGIRLTKVEATPATHALG